MGGARRGACWLLAGGSGQGRAVGTNVPGYSPWEQEQGTMLPDSVTGNRNKEHSSQIQGQGTGTGTNGTVRSQSLGTEFTGTRRRNTPPCWLLDAPHSLTQGALPRCARAAFSFVCGRARMQRPAVSPKTSYFTTAVITRTVLWLLLFITGNFGESTLQRRTSRSLFDGFDLDVWYNTQSKRLPGDETMREEQEGSRAKHGCPDQH